MGILLVGVGSRWGVATISFFELVVSISISFIPCPNPVQNAGRFHMTTVPTTSVLKSVCVR